MTSQNERHFNIKPTEAQPIESGRPPFISTTAGETVTETHLTTPKEIGGRSGLDPVRYGDWEKKGRCIDF